MSIKELRIFLINNDLNITSFSKLIDVRRKLVYNWIEGYTKIPSYVDEFCRNYNKCS